jgi:hypothetical protein
MLAERVGDVARDAMVINKEHPFIDESFLKRGLMRLQRCNGKITEFTCGSSGMEDRSVDDACKDE